MSSKTSITYLNRKKKEELQDLANDLGIGVDGLNKTDMIETIKSHLRTHPLESTSPDSEKDSAYGRGSVRGRNASDGSDAEDSEEKHTRGRARKTVRALRQPTMESVSIAQDEIEDAKHSFGEVGSAVKSKAARASDRVKSKAAKATEYAENKSNDVIQYVENKVGEAYNWLRRGFGLEEVELKFSETRQSLSNSALLLGLTILAEYVYYLFIAIPRDYQIHIQAIDKPAYIPDWLPLPQSWFVDYDFTLPNIFYVLHSEFWTPLLGYGFLLLVLPFAVSYLINFEPSRYRYSPLTFAIIKFALVWYAHNVWSQQVEDGKGSLLAQVGVEVVSRWGPALLLVGTGVVAVLSFQEIIVGGRS